MHLLYTFFTTFVYSLSVFFFPISYKERITEVTRKYGKRCEYCSTMLKYTGMSYLGEHILLSYQFEHEIKLRKKKQRGKNEVLKTQSHSLWQLFFFTAKYLLDFAHSFFNHLFRLRAWLKLLKALPRPYPSPQSQRC